MNCVVLEVLDLVLGLALSMGMGIASIMQKCGHCRVRCGEGIPMPTAVEFVPGMSAS